MFSIRYIDTSGVAHWWHYLKSAANHTEAEQIRNIFKEEMKQQNISWVSIDREYWS